MSSLEERIHAAVIGNAAVSALLGDRLYLVQLPQGPEFPCAVYQRISTVPVTTMNQAANWQGMGWCRFTFQVWCKGPSAGIQTDTISRAIQVALQSFNGYNQAATQQAPNFLLTRTMSVEPNTQPPLYTSRSDYKIFYTEN